MRGLRAMDDLAELYRSLDLRDLQTPYHMGARWLEGRRTVEDLGAVGQVELSGRITGRPRTTRGAPGAASCPAAAAPRRDRLAHLAPGEG